MTDIVPADIPLYPGFRWSTLMEASIFTGDSSIPSGYDLGQVLISNWLTNVTADEVWNYYNNQTNKLMTTLGWTLTSVAPAQGAASFTAEYKKGSRYVTIKCYNAGSQGAGYRLEMWYK